MKNDIPEELKNEAVQACLKGVGVDEVAEKIRAILEPKIIDMSVFIESGIDMMFSNELIKWYTSVLYSIGLKTVKKYCTHGGDEYGYCNPRFNYIYACPNGFAKCPVPPGFRVRIYHRSGGYAQVDSSNFKTWQHLNGDDDTIAFEILELADGWKFP